MKRLVSSDLFRFDRRRVLLALSFLIALKVVLLFVLAWNSRFVMDEFGQLGFAKYLPDDFFDTVWPAKAVGYAIFYKLSHLLGWDATSILLIGRIQTAFLACGTLSIVYACARALGENRLRALLILLVLLSFSTFMERIFRTRAEPLAVFFAAAALLVLLRGEADRLRTLLLAGILSGLAFLATQKAVYFNVALGAALLVDAALARQFFASISRGIWLVLGWLVSVIAYCILFGGTDPLPIAKSLVFGPVEVTMQGASAYTNLRGFVVQTLTRNAPLYGLCFAGMALSLTRIVSLDQPQRIALLFTLLISVLVFAHDQPWPYVFVMALPFIALWSMVPFDRFATERGVRAILLIALAMGVVPSFVKNLIYIDHDNRDQLILVERAESLLATDQIYFDGIGMLPTRREPSTLWLDSLYVQKTLHQQEESEAYRIFAFSPPRVIIWSYRMNAIYPVIAAHVQNSYVRIAPNLYVAGRLLKPDESMTFDAPIAGNYGLYSANGNPVDDEVDVDGELLESPFWLDKGQRSVELRTERREALLLLHGDYRGIIALGVDDNYLFEEIYTK